MPSNAVGWFEIYVQDMQRARAFYEQVFHVDFTNLDSPGIEMLAFPMSMESPGSTGALVRAHGVPSGPGGTLVYFVCEDCATEASRVVEAGGSIEKDKFSIGDYGFIALAYDTEGNMIGLHSMQ